jgi:hypothetical protein
VLCPAGNKAVQAVQQQRAAVFTTLVEQVMKLYNAAPSGTLFVAVSGQGNTPYQRYLEDQRYSRQNTETTMPWGIECEATWQQHAARAVSALCYVKVKKD